MARNCALVQGFPQKLLLFFIFLFLFLLFARLGVWQLERYHEKKIALQHYHTLHRQSTQPWRPSDPFPKEYEKRSIQGHFIEPFFFLDNQYHHHQVGYHVLGLFLIDKQHYILVDRGWIPKEDRSKIKHTEESFLEGHVYYPSKKQWTLGEAIEYQGKDIIFERLDPNLIAQALQKTIYPFIIRERTKETTPFIQDWTIINMPPKRHLAYAFQWFALSLLTIILFIVYLISYEK